MKTSTILTKKLQPTNTLGERVKATDELSGTSVTVPWDYSKGTEEMHRSAARRLALGKIMTPTGDTPTGYIFTTEEA